MTVPSASTLTKALATSAGPAFFGFAAAKAGIWTASVSPAAPSMKRRRLMLAIPVSMARSSGLGQPVGGVVDRGADAHVGRAATDVAAHRLVDVFVARLRIARQQRRGAHDLARLAVA